MRSQSGTNSGIAGLRTSRDPGTISNGIRISELPGILRANTCR